MTSRGIRTNNPFNIVASGAKWLGLDSPPDDGRFCRFVSPEMGIRAGCKTLLTYFDRYGLDTVRSIINRFAPPSENDTGAYIFAVSKLLGVGPDEAINVRDPQTMEWLVTGIIRQENGTVPYPQALIHKAMGLAGISITP